MLPITTKQEQQEPRARREKSWAKGATGEVMAEHSEAALWREPRSISDLGPLSPAECEELEAALLAGNTQGAMEIACTGLMPYGFSQPSRPGAKESGQN